MGDREKAYFLDLMRKLAAFCGIEVITHAILDNHWHCLLHIPERKELSDEELLARLRLIWDRQQVGEVEQRMERFKGYETPRAYEAERAKHLDRMYDLGEYMKAVKQQFTRWYNRRKGRKGTLWEARYKSVVVEGARDPLLTMATYIDLNAVRAGLCADPKDYRWCGYGEALGGGKAARAGLKLLAERLGRSTDWRMVNRMYRQWIFAAGEEKGLSEDGSPAQKGFSREEVARVWKEGGELSRTELLRCRVRYFTDGAAIGSKGFVQELFEACRDRFGERRERGGSMMRGGGFGELHVLRNLQVGVVG